MSSESREVARKTLNIAQLLSMPVPLIPTDEARELHASLRDTLNMWKSIGEVLPDHERLLSQLNATILAKAFRGELVLQDPNDEPASVLLERIAAERAAAGRAVAESNGKKPRSGPRPVLGELSAEAKAARAPLRPEELVEAQHDRVHRDPGRARAARTVRNSRRGTT